MVSIICDECENGMFITNESGEPKCTLHLDAPIMQITRDGVTPYAPLDPELTVKVKNVDVLDIDPKCAVNLEPNRSRSIMFDDDIVTVGQYYMHTKNGRVHHRTGELGPIPVIGEISPHNRDRFVASQYCVPDASCAQISINGQYWSQLGALCALIAHMDRV